MSRPATDWPRFLMDKASTIFGRKQNTKQHSSNDKKVGWHLENSIPGITQPFEFGYIDELEYLTAPITINRRGGDGRGFLVFLPYYFPEIFFGGNFAFFQFLSSLKQHHGGALKLVIVKRVPAPDTLEVNIDRVRQTSPEIAELFSSFHLLPKSRTIDVDGQYGVISFCAETHFVASDAARQLNVTPIFVVQDYEPDLNPAGSLRTFARSAFDLPHIGVYNSSKLYEYLRDLTNITQIADRNYRYVTFENPIKPMPWDLNTFRSRHASKTKNRLIVYARPESLGARNEFATIILALKQALRLGYLDEARWEFCGIGSVLPRRDIQLTQHSRMEFVPKLPLDQYEEYILLGDLGISLVSTPHPGLVHFQMANFGLTTVTYATAGRSAEWIKSQNKNLVPSLMTIDGLCQAIAQAVDLSADIDARYKNAVEFAAQESTDTIDAAAKKVLTLQ